MKCSCSNIPCILQHASENLKSQPAWSGSSPKIWCEFCLEITEGSNILRWNRPMYAFIHKYIDNYTYICTHTYIYISYIIYIYTVCNACIYDITTHILYMLKIQTIYYNGDKNRYSRENNAICGSFVTTMHLRSFLHLPLPIIKSVQPVLYIYIYTYHLNI